MNLCLLTVVLCRFTAIADFSLMSSDLVCKFTVAASSCTNEEEGDVRLVDSVSMYEGRVEVCTSREWGTICNRNWYNQEAMVVCRQLGFHTDGEVKLMPIICLT